MSRVLQGHEMGLDNQEIRHLEKTVHKYVTQTSRWFIERLLFADTVCQAYDRQLVNVC